LLLLAVYQFVFTSIFRAGAFDGRSFLLFVAVALWPWLAAQDGLSRATVAIPGYGALIPKVAFPHEVVIYASVAATFALQMAGYLVVLIVLFAFGEPVRFEGLVLAIPLWAILALAVTGIALALAAQQVFVRDVEHVLAPLLTILMYLTPILYPLRLVAALLRGRPAADVFCALDGITLEMSRGESLGVIGENGGGKSTLLKIIVGVIKPTRGTVAINGRVGALLELGSGFHPEYTGRANIDLAATLLGIPPSEIAAKRDQIIAFADIGSHIDDPIKHYSSGMVVRLGFA